MKQKYKITYDNGMVQHKYLITEHDYANILKPIEFVIRDMEEKNKFKSTKESNILKAYLVKKFGDVLFTEESPLGKAIKSGILSLPETQGGDSKCIIKKA